MRNGFRYRVNWTRFAPICRQRVTWNLPLSFQNFLELGALYFDLPFTLMVEYLQVGLAIGARVEFRNVLLGSVMDVVLLRGPHESEISLDVPVGAGTSRRL